MTQHELPITTRASVRLWAARSPEKHAVTWLSGTLTRELDPSTLWVRIALRGDNVALFATLDDSTFLPGHDGSQGMAIQRLAKVGAHVTRSGE